MVFPEYDGITKERAQEVANLLVTRFHYSAWDNQEWFARGIALQKIMGNVPGDRVVKVIGDLPKRIPSP